MVSNPYLQRLVDRDTFGEIVAALTPREVVIASLRLEGLNDGEIARLLGVTRSTVQRHMRRARQRIAREQPDARSWLGDRRPAPRSRPREGQPPPLDRGWICRPEAPPLIVGVDEAAEQLDVQPPTIRAWCRAGRFPHAHHATGPRTEWRIPLADIEALDRARQP